MLKTTKQFLELQQARYREAVSPWGLPLEVNSFKQLREEENSGYFFKKAFSFLTGKNSRPLKNNNGFYFNLVCPPIIDSLRNIFKDHFRFVYDKINPSKIIWGTLPDYDINAKSIKTNGEIYIVLNESLLYLLYETYRIIFYVMYSNSLQGSGSHLELKIQEKDFPRISKKYHDYFREIYSSFLFTGISKSKRQGVPNEEAVNRAAAHVFDTSIFFALSHEYSHVYLDHFSNKVESSEEMEEQADAIAGLSSLYYNASKKYDPSFFFMSLQMFFTFAKFIGVIIDKSKDNHPAIDERRYDVVGKCMTLIYKDNNLIQRHYADSVKFGDTIYNLLFHLWEQVQDKILSDYQGILDGRIGDMNQNRLSSRLSLVTKYFKKENTIEKMFDRLLPFIRHILDDNNRHKTAIRALASNPLDDDSISDAVSSIFFRIQFSNDRTEEGQSELAYNFFQKSHHNKLSSSEFRQIFDYVLEEFIKYAFK